MKRLSFTIGRKVIDARVPRGLHKHPYSTKEPPGMLTYPRHARF